MVSDVKTTLNNVEKQFKDWMPTTGKTSEVTCKINGVNITIYFQRVYNHRLFDPQPNAPKNNPLPHKMNVISDDPKIREVFENHFPKSRINPNNFALNGSRLRFDLRFFHNKIEFQENLEQERIKYGPSQRSCGKVCVNACFVV